MAAGSKQCPICARDVAPREKNPAFPFCTPRCKTIDLGKWVNEEYRIPADDAEPEGEDDERDMDVRH